MINFDKWKITISGFGSIYNIIIFLYVLFLFAVPGDVFERTAFDVLTKNDEMYYAAQYVYVSFLYLPVVLVGIPILLKTEFGRKSFVFLGVVAVKDCILFAINSPHYFRYDMYYIYVVALCVFAILTSFIRNEVSIDFFIYIFTFILLSTLLFSVLTGVGTGMFGFEKRYHSSGLSQGETAYLLALLSAYYLFCKDRNRDKLLGVVCVAGIIATGTRKEVLFLTVLFLCKLLFDLFGGKIKIKKLNKRFLSILTLISICIVVFLPLVKISGNKFLDRIDISRFSSLLKDKNIISTIGRDGSFIGRIDSIRVGIEVLRKSPLLGCFFSFFDLQYNMQREGYPTFPHSSLLFYMCVLGIPIVLYFLAKLCLILRKCFVQKSKLLYVYIYFLAHNTISGGALLSLKVVFFNLFIIYVIERSINVSIPNEQI